MEICGHEAHPGHEAPVPPHPKDVGLLLWQLPECWPFLYIYIFLGIQETGLIFILLLLLLRGPYFPFKRAL